jgi:endonuclease/exonuclease/phosphatase (EEP) superfamily protein YafD
MILSGQIPPYKRIIDRILHGALWVIGLIGILWFVVQMLAPWGAVALIGHVLAPWYLLVLGVAIGVSFWYQKYLASLLLSIAILAIGSFYARSLLPRTVDLPKNTRALRVLSFNTWGNTTAPSKNIDGVAKVIVDAKPDVAVLQEFDPKQLPKLREMLDDANPGIYKYELGDVLTQQVVVSRYPVELIKVDTQQSRVLRARVNVAGENIQVWSVHAYRTSFLPGQNFLSYRDPSLHRAANEQFGWLAQAVKAVQEPLIVVGDFNMPFSTAPMQSLGLREAQEEAGWLLGFTFPASAEHKRQIHILGQSISLASPICLARIDHILYSRRWFARAAYVLDATAGSDHAPITAELVLR